MASTSLLFIELPVIVVLLHSLLISASALTSSSPSHTGNYIIHNQQQLTAFPPTLLASIFSALGFQELSSATLTTNLSANTPLTIFAPSDSSILTCPSCSLPLLLKEHSVPGLYPLSFLRTMPFGTKIETLAIDYCLTITTSDAKEDSKAVFVNGVPMTRPDLFNNGVLMIHGLQGFVSHLSPLSCNVERMASLSFPHHSQLKLPPSANFSVMRLMLNEAIARLRLSGCQILAIALKVHYKELCELKAMTVFALNDAAVITWEGRSYLSSFLLHVVPNRRLMAAELLSLSTATSLPTMQSGQNLVVTTSAGGGPLAPLKINYVQITTLDLLHNSRIVVHAVSTPFPHLHHRYAAPEETCDPEWTGGLCQMEAAVPAGSRNSSDAEDHHGL